MTRVRTRAPHLEMDAKKPVFVFTEEERAAAVKIGAAGDELERRAARLTAKIEKALKRNDQPRVQRIMRQWRSLAADADRVKAAAETIVARGYERAQAEEAPL